MTLNPCFLVKQQGWTVSLGLETQNFKLFLEIMDVLSFRLKRKITIQNIKANIGNGIAMC